MKLRCPNCGHAASILDFANEQAARQVVYLAADLPKPLGKLVMRYIGLFRPAQRSLSWERTLKLMQQLKTDIDAGRIEYKGRIWAAPDGLWHKALTTMIEKSEQQDGLMLPLKNHNYLYTIISSEQNSIEAREEQKIEEKRQQAQHRKTVTAIEQPNEQTEQTKEIGDAVLAELRSNPKFRKRGEKS